VAVSSGTAALHLAMLAAGVEAGDEVVGPAVTFLASTNAGLYAGATVRFTDVEPRSVLMTPALLEPVLSDRTRAVVPVHFAGRPCDMAALSALVRRRCPAAMLIEDACHALGSTHDDGAPVGTLAWSDMAVLSFHPVKAITTGEGGMILTDREDLAARLRQLRSHGTTKDPAELERPDEGPWYYEMQALGFNYRIPDLNCALGLAQLAKLDRFVARRRALAERYRRELGNLPATQVPEASPRSAWHLFALHVDFQALGKPRRCVVEELRGLGVGTQVHYFPVPLQPYYRRRFGFAPGAFPCAERHYQQALSIPLYPAMSDEDAARVIAALVQVIR
jgi:dTDP-4-amino-4,6-dideoxygalactose transaminase